MQIRDRRSTITLVLVGVIVLLALGAAGFFAKQYYDLKANPNKVAQEETVQLMEAVEKLYELPKDEEPIVGEVKDKEKLKDQPFFKNSQNGDKILIYQKAKIAIIYRQKENKLINVGPIAIDATQEGTEQENNSNDSSSSSQSETDAEANTDAAETETQSTDVTTNP